MERPEWLEDNPLPVREELGIAPDENLAGTNDPGTAANYVSRIEDLDYRIEEKREAGKPTLPLETERERLLEFARTRLENERHAAEVNIDPGEQALNQDHQVAMEGNDWRAERMGVGTGHALWEVEYPALARQSAEDHGLSPDDAHVSTVSREEHPEHEGYLGREYRGLRSEYRQQVAQELGVDPALYAAVTDQEDHRQGGRLAALGLEDRNPPESELRYRNLSDPEQASRVAAERIQQEREREAYEEEVSRLRSLSPGKEPQQAIWPLDKDTEQYLDGRAEDGAKGTNRQVERREISEGPFSDWYQRREEEHVGQLHHGHVKQDFAVEKKLADSCREAETQRRHKLQLVRDSSPDHDRQTNQGDRRQPKVPFKRRGKVNQRDRDDDRGIDRDFF